jgi:hypothetical protein
MVRVRVGSVRQPSSFLWFAETETSALMSGPTNVVADRQAKRVLSSVTQAHECSKNLECINYNCVLYLKHNIQLQFSIFNVTKKHRFNLYLYLLCDLKNI